MEALKHKNSNVQEPNVMDNCKKSALIDCVFVDTSVKSISDIYELFYTTNSTREIFEKANSNQLVITNIDFG